MEISVKNHADALIFHTAICAGGAANSFYRRAESDIQPAVPSTHSVCGMEINMEDNVVSKNFIEQFIDGREFSIGVMDGKALPIIEIAPKVGFYDYKNKYQAGSTIETCPADLPQDVTAKMQSCAEEVYHALRLQTYVRMDFRMDNEYNFYCLEANTLPGMTPTSLLPQEAAAVGVDFASLCEQILDISMKKY